MKLKLDAKTIAGLALGRGKSEDFAWDTELENFGVRLRRRRDGRLQRTWVVQYRANSHSRRISLGTLERVTITQARDAARKILARVVLGHDPQAERGAKRAQAARTFRSAVEAYLAAKHSELRPTSFRIDRLYLSGPYFRPLHAMGIAEIAHADIAARLSAISRAHSTTTAGAARRAVSGLFTFCMQEGWLQANPVIGTRKPADAPSRDHVLTEAELTAVWRACDDDDHGRIIHLMILMPNRRSETGGMCWSELNLDAGTWTLPGTRAKNGRAFTVTPPPTALEIIRSIPRSDRDNLFGRRSDAGFTRWAEEKQKLDKRLGETVRPWRTHDIRRTVATHMADIGIEPHIIEACLNHYSGHRAGVAGVYNRSPYANAVKSALARWDVHVCALIEGRENRVVTLRK
jgi:integrase